MSLSVLPVRHISLLFMLLILISGCAAQEAVRAERYLWPPPPDVPRIEWIKTYATQLDIEKSFSQRLLSSVAGESPAISLKKPVEVKSIPELKRFYVSDLGRSAVVVFDLAGHELRALETPSGVLGLAHPLSIVVDRDKNLYVLDRRSLRVLVFDSSEKYLRSIDLGAARIASPVTMAIDKKRGWLYVSDAAARKIVVLGLDGGYLKSIGSPGDADGQFNLPIAIATNSKGHILVADAFAANVQIFDAEGRFIRKIGRRGDAQGDLQLVKSVAVDSNDNIYVVDGRSHSVTIFTETGELLLSFGGYYTTAVTGKLAPGGFAIPVAIDIDADDKIYIVDQMNARVQVFQYLSEAYYRRNPTTR